MCYVSVDDDDGVAALVFAERGNGEHDDNQDSQGANRYESECNESMQDASADTQPHELREQNRTAEDGNEDAGTETASGGDERPAREVEQHATDHENLHAESALAVIIERQGAHDEQGNDSDEDD
jgi:hypothetical protein